MSADAFLFWFLAVITTLSGLMVITVRNPVYSALSLAMTMVGVSALFVTLNAHFIAGVQLIVYAGAVMVLFVMVIMLFDLKQEVRTFTRGAATGLVKLMGVGMLLGVVAGTIFLSKLADGAALTPAQADTLNLGKILFSKYILGFEILGVLLLVVAVGCVALARSKGGTHAR